MGLSAASLEWLRSVHDAASSPAGVADPLDTALELGQIAAQIPAWQEPMRAIMAKLLGASSQPSSTARSRIERCPQVVDVDFPNLAMTRAEWVRNSLHLTLAPASPDPSHITEFRIVGVEPRIWWQTGIDGAATDVRSDCVVVRSPLVAGDLAFTPGSY
ncbi:MAG: hypothetical protein ACE37B_20690 [Ilumatobacter sp.]|uniref:hypothetical protein n=1 Tax=Ilumatobacter sp. TaxID=1967498 RepID=UPI00391B40A6